MDKSKTSNVSINGLGLQALTIAFIVLKLIGEITWSWAWVLSPIWIPLAIVIVLLCVIAIIKAATKK
jgi:hypothetical protein